MARLEQVEYVLGRTHIRPFDPSADYFRDRVDFDRERLALLLRLIEEHRGGDDILELAAAPYILTAKLLDRGCAVTLTGLPFDGHSEATALLTVDGERHACALHLTDAEEVFPFDASAFDVVVAGEIFEHLYRQPWVLLSESWRCLRAGGILVLSTPNSESLDRLFAWMRRLAQEQGFNPEAPTVRHAREYGPDELRQVVESQGFDILALQTPNISRISRFSGPLGAVKRLVHATLTARASRPSGLLANRGNTILLVARKSDRRPDIPPELMTYALGDPRSGYNFPAGVSSVHTDSPPTAH